MEHAEVITEQPGIESQELPTAYLDMATLYEWLDRPVTEDEDDVTG